MSKLLTIITIALLPLTAFAKTGESRADFERSHTKVLTALDELRESGADFEPSHVKATLEGTAEMLKLIPDGAAYKDKKTGYWFLAWFQLDKFAGAARPVDSDEGLTKFVQLVLGTTDLETRTDVNPLLKTMGMQAFSTKDGKLAFNMYSPDNEGANRVVIAGTRAFIETYEAIVLLLKANHRFDTSAPAPTPSPTPAPVDVTWKFTTELGKVIGPATAVLSDVNDPASAQLAVLTFKAATMQLKTLKDLWARVPSKAKPALKASMNSAAEAFQDLERTLPTDPGLDSATVQTLSDYVEALKSFQP